jgi:hypothetical protein
MVRSQKSSFDVATSGSRESYTIPGTGIILNSLEIAKLMRSRK